MLVFPLFELLLLACTAAWSRALRSQGRSVARQARAASDSRPEVVGVTSSPNHLPEGGFSEVTPGGSYRSTMVTTTVGDLPQTTTTTTTTTAVQSSTKPNISLTTSFSSPNVTHLQNQTTTPTWDFTTNTTTTTSTPSTPSTPSLTTKTGPQCNCSTDGSVDPHSCDPHTGGCTCVRGYTGFRCEQCYSGYFRNHTGACQPCDCDSSGATGPQCNRSGVCECKSGVYGDKCDDCQPAFFNFSSAGCQACQCNNHSSTCDRQSGVCLYCQGNTRGPSCEECKPHFYREPGASPSKSCLPCPCSTVTSSGNCTLDERGRPVCDQCNPGYEGSTCENCSDGYYNADSICVPCECNGNTRICNPETGHCLNCSYNTTGPHCQHCAPGFTGDALARNCTAIVPTTPAYFSTMTPSPNVTDQLPTSSTALLSSLTSPTANSTTPPVQLTWAQFNLIILAVIITLILALLGAAGGIYTYRQYQNRKINAPFWTIELKEDNISFSSYHDSLTNADASGLLDDETCEAASNGQLTLNSPGSLYMP
ncbi:multiple epidermal growth factor-like domains protein 9 [Clarias gariepinus]|uniref:multiple epidermal growth factor-like domains protein 9 n=1 Tax=Clarias gariepinus TaxID=13013 RepID=UPI00234CDC24|nr:multiple epidermal growth factor-like domains protein 9 [Clarias gariepinus]